MDYTWSFSLRLRRRSTGNMKDDTATLQVESGGVGTQQLQELRQPEQQGGRMEAAARRGADVDQGPPPPPGSVADLGGSKQTVVCTHTKGSKDVHHITSAEKSEAISVIACCNAEDNFLPPYSIFKGKRKKPEFDDGMPPDSSVRMNKISGYPHNPVPLDRSFLKPLKTFWQQDVSVFSSGVAVEISATLSDNGQAHRPTASIRASYTSAPVNETPNPANDVSTRSLGEDGSKSSFQEITPVPVIRMPKPTGLKKEKQTAVVLNTPQ
ncbi:hypothetical protein PR048_020435 [Dryococelus australis]|uniref:Uncharacterized protein n=1 Tax=Dryococelus australis TaxID=614101 RepID=A0ABQ9H6A7_9NEOP|nr:hypothetical protein PR048_020435 [Dryococelus australis]